MNDVNLVTSLEAHFAGLRISPVSDADLFTRYRSPPIDDCPYLSRLAKYTIRKLSSVLSSGVIRGC